MHAQIHMHLSLSPCVRTRACVWVCVHVCVCVCERERESEWEKEREREREREMQEFLTRAVWMCRWQKRTPWQMYSLLSLVFMTEVDHEAASKMVLIQGCFTLFFFSVHFCLSHNTLYDFVSSTVSGAVVTNINYSCRVGKWQNSSSMNHRPHRSPWRDLSSYSASVWHVHTWQTHPLSAAEYKEKIKFCKLMNSVFPKKWS